MVKISFILPMYKSEKYLPRVVDSIKNQTLTDFEAIFIDDGSPDNSAELCLKLFVDDERFKLLQKENGGVASARNAGLDAACGKYIFFVDSDDWIEKDSAKILYETAERENADLIIFGVYVDRCGGDGAELTSRDISLPEADGIFRGTPCVEKFDKIATEYLVTNKLFKRDIIEKNNLRFHNMNIGEDGMFFTEYCRTNPGCLVFLAKPLYHHIEYGAATLSSSYHKERLDDNFYLSDAVRKNIEAWGMTESKMHLQTLNYCIIRDLQYGIKNINLSGKTLRERWAWIKNMMRDKSVRTAVKETSLSAAQSRNDKIKLLLLKLKMYRIVIFVSALNRRG